MYEQAVRHTNNDSDRSSSASAAAAHGATGGVVAEGVSKRFGELWALRDLHLEVRPGTVLGLLGHNGAGKTTAIRILTTLSRPTEGSATVAGHDVVHHAAEVRRRIGVANQQATVDGLMPGRLNLEMVGRLHGMSTRDARRRADELLEQLDLVDSATKLVKSYSGGMRRRLDLAAALMARPDVLFLDEPTTGLDPRSRGDLWGLLRELVRDGTTLILTTQYLEEADRLADDIVVLDHGRTVAHGTPDELKSRVGDDRIDITVRDDADLVAAGGAIGRYVSNDPTFDADVCKVSAPVRDGVRLIDIVRALDDAGIDALDIDRRQATLDDVFLALTSAPRTTTPQEVAP